MAKMKKKKRKTTDTWKKKEWYVIQSPKKFNSKIIGSTPTDNPKKIKNRVITIPLSDITGNLRQMAIKISFKAEEVKGRTIMTKFHRFELAREYLRRNVSRNRSMIRAIETLKTKDNKNVLISAYAFTYRRIDTSKKDALRKLMISELHRLLSEMTLEEAIEKGIYGKISTELLKSLKTITRIRRVEVGKFELYIPKKERTPEAEALKIHEEEPETKSPAEPKIEEAKPVEVTEND